MVDAAILVGGKGSRLGKITKYGPKSLLKVGKIRFLDLIISYLLKYNLKKKLRKLSLINLNFTNEGSKIIFNS